MLRRSHSESAGHFWQPAEFENVANPDFENFKHLQNPGYLLLTAPSSLLQHFVEWTVPLNFLWINYDL